MLLLLVHMPISIPLCVLKLGCTPFLSVLTVLKAIPRFYYSDCLSFEHGYTSESSGAKGGGEVGGYTPFAIIGGDPSCGADRL
jgi:hypothetical protein